MLKFDLKRRNAVNGVASPACTPTGRPPGESAPRNLSISEGWGMGEIALADASRLHRDGHPTRQSSRCGETDASVYVRLCECIAASYKDYKCHMLSISAANPLSKCRLLVMCDMYRPKRTV